MFAKSLQDMLVRLHNECSDYEYKCTDDGRVWLVIYEDGVPKYGRLFVNKWRAYQFCGDNKVADFRIVGIRG